LSYKSSSNVGSHAHPAQIIVEAGFAHAALGKVVGCGNQVGAQVGGMATPRGVQHLNRDRLWHQLGQLPLQTVGQSPEQGSAAGQINGSAKSVWLSSKK